MEKATKKETYQIRGIHCTTKAGRNRIQACNKYQESIDFLNTLDDYKGLSKNDKDQLWFRYKLREEERNAIAMRPTLGVAGPTINLNTCALDELQRIPKLTRGNCEDLIRLRHAHPRGIQSWEDVRKIKGI